VWGYSLYHASDLPFRKDLRDLPDTFTPFKDRVERTCQVRVPLPRPQKGALPLSDAAREAASEDAPTWADLPYDERVQEPAEDSRSAFKLQGGESAAQRRLKHYLWDSNCVAKYFDTRNRMLGEDYSTKLAAHLAHGCISPRRIYHEIKRYEKERTANKSTYWVLFELTWRDFYRFFTVKHGNRVFHSGGTVGARSSWSQDPEALKRWKEGRTGWPLVDANMRELAATGFMSNRGRQNVASFLALDLGLDWRAGADHFESFLVDYDVSSNWGNWVAAAGLTGGRVNKFNVTKQGFDYDAEGEYARTWIPELRRVQGSTAHEPWVMSPAEKRRLDAEAYPQRLRRSDVASGRPARGGKRHWEGDSGGGPRKRAVYSGWRSDWELARGG